MSLSHVEFSEFVYFEDQTQGTVNKHKLCLSGLNDRDRKTAHGELVGLQLLMDDVILSSYHMIVESLPRQQATEGKNTQVLWRSFPGLYLPKRLEFRSWFLSCPKASALQEGSRDALTSLALLRSFLILWKQLEVLKEHWGHLKLQGQEVNTLLLHKQFTELYKMDIFYPSMKAIARQMGKEDEFEGLIINNQPILPPKGASEIEIKTQQLQKLLESLEIHMIQEVLRKVNRDMTLVISEKSKEECTLPTELWKHQVMKESFSVIRPQVVENFIQRLMENYHDDELEITFSKDHLKDCLLSLGCDVMARERSNFETYSMSYEHVLQHVQQRLSQKEQELEAIQRSQRTPEEDSSQVTELSHDMIMEITALRAQLTDLEEENLNLRKQIQKEVREEYEALVQALFVTCLHIEEKLDENQLNLIQNVCELISEVRREGIDNMKDLKKRWGSARPEKGMKESPDKEQLQTLEEDNRSLAALVCKARILGRWRLAVQQAHFRGQLSRAQEEVIQNKKECLRTKLMAEQEVVLLRQELQALRQALARAQADNISLWRRHENQDQLLKELEHKVTQEALNQQQLDLMRTSSIEKLLGDVEQKEQQLQLLAEEAERTSRLGQFEQKKIKRKIRQMRSQLAQERSMKLDAFQRVEELKSKLNDTEQSSVQMSSPGGHVSRALYSLSSTSTSSRYSQQHFLKTNLRDNKIRRGIQRPKTVPTKHTSRIKEVFLPNVVENIQLAGFQVQTAPARVPFRPDWFHHRTPGFARRPGPETVYAKPNKPPSSEMIKMIDYKAQRKALGLACNFGSAVWPISHLSAAATAGRSHVLSSEPREETTIRVLSPLPTEALPTHPGQPATDPALDAGRVAMLPESPPHPERGRPGLGPARTEARNSIGVSAGQRRKPAGPGPTWCGRGVGDSGVVEFESTDSTESAARQVAAQRSRRESPDIASSELELANSCSAPRSASVSVPCASDPRLRSSRGRARGSREGPAPARALGGEAAWRRGADDTNGNATSGGSRAARGSRDGLLASSSKPLICDEETGPTKDVAPFGYHSGREQSFSHGCNKEGLHPCLDGPSYVTWRTESP
ncbi:PREDICTED: coiled-coil domain-containing protein 162-like [Elephantulus edwardii]|uniref:coiled-coil domain-containing protein 162-like n=1 Tax=Elephantulus edwardii TaxID=28737 RepID=UPI0003F0AE56|nr:PREDICTED: coiled-coil domain-containing protein 162-like [Elephantulus edwardii]